MIEFRIVPHGGAEYDQTVSLRLAVLRKPLGLDFTPEDLAAESNEIHLAAFEGPELIACLILGHLDKNVFKMRQVAVSPERQGQGMGRSLVKESENFARNQGGHVMTLNARDTAVPFYLALGYELFGDPFEEVGIPHRSMRKNL